MTRRIFITGLTGTLGTAIAKLHHAKGDIVLGCSRSEDRAIKWLRENKNTATLILGDAAYLADTQSQLGSIIHSVDRVYHLAAMKHVDLCELHPYEAFTQNVHLTSLISQVCEKYEKELIFSSSDKACLPISTYGATKLLGEKIVLNSGGSVVRLGNIIGSSGSVFKKWAESNTIELTDPDMTRFFIEVDNAAIIMSECYTPGNINVPKLHSARMGDIVDKLTIPSLHRKHNKKVNIIGRRPGETQHQLLDVLPDSPENNWCKSELAPRWNINELLACAGVFL